MFLKHLTLTSLVIASIAGFSIQGHAQSSGLLTAPLTNSSFTFCNWNNYIATSDVEAARQVLGSSAYFYVTENTSNNVVNGKCVNNLVANFVPYIAGHKTSFDISNTGVATNIKLVNDTPSIESISCNDEETQIIIKDPNQDRLTYNTVIGLNDFDLTITESSNNSLKVVTKKKNFGFTGSNNITLYVNEVAPTNLIGGYANILPNSSVPVTYNNVAVKSDKEFSTVKFDFQINANCSGQNNNNPQPNLPVNKIYWLNNSGTHLRWNLSGTRVVSTQWLDTVDTSWIVGAIADFNSDGNDDILWRNKNSSSTLIWYLDSNGRYSSNKYLDNVDTSWMVSGASDYNGDGKPDIFWRNKNDGSNLIWLSSNSGYSSNNKISIQQVGTEWKVVSFGDQNGDGKPDIFWRNKNDGSNVIWYNTSGNYSVNNSRWLQRINNDWEVVSFGDFNGDSKSDIFWHNIDGSNLIWLNNGDNTYSISNSVGLLSTGSEWTPKVRN
jgi:FG-GAP-like repeat